MATYNITVHELLERIAKDDAHYNTTTPTCEPPAKQQLHRNKPKRSDSVMSWLSTQSSDESEVDFTDYRHHHLHERKSSR